MKSSANYSSLFDSVKTYRAHHALRVTGTDLLPSVLQASTVKQAALISHNCRLADFIGANRLSASALKDKGIDKVLFDVMRSRNKKELLY